MNTKDKLEAMKKVNSANVQHEQEWREKRVMRLPVTPERRNIWEHCMRATENCDGCPHRYKCEDLFPVNTPWGRFTIPADFHLNGDNFVIEEEKTQSD